MNKEDSCKGCTKDCGEKGCEEKPPAISSVKKVVGIVSGKGGVGKSIITSMLAVCSQREGLKTAILDADITGPSIPKVFGVKGRAQGEERGIIPAQSPSGIKIMSSNLLLEHPTDPVIWRGPLVSNMVKQFWTDVVWGDVDIMFIDMPPGTGDVSLTVFQSIPVSGIIVVTSPQELVSMIVAKAVKMADMMNIPVLGIIENMSYAVCSHCGEQIKVFGESNLEQSAKEFNIDILGRIPLQPALAAACDKGEIESFKGDWLDKALKKII